MTDQATGLAAPDVEIFDPPLCCPTGLCGPVLDTTLVDLSEAIFTLEAEGRTGGPPHDDRGPPGVHAQPRGLRADQGSASSRCCRSPSSAGASSRPTPTRPSTSSTTELAASA